MSKKNKNKVVDYFNMTPEEQMANAEIFNDVERGEASILDALNLKVSSGPIRQSDLKRQIAEACFGINTEDKHVENEKVVSNEMNHEDDSNVDVSIVENEDKQITTVIEEVITKIETESVIEKVDEVHETTEVTSINVPRIHFRYEPIIGKMLIDDGLVSTPVSIIHSSSIELNPNMLPNDEEEENVDGDTLAQMLSKIFYFVITCKHPAVIMSQETFEIEFSMFSKLNFNRFIFFKNAGYVYVYVLDEGEVANFYSVEKIFRMDSSDILRYAVSAAYAANTIHNIFMYDDEDEVKSVMDARYFVKDLLKLIENDPATEYAGHNASGDVMNRMKVRDLQKFVNDTRCMLDNLIDVDEDDDDEDYEDEEYTDADDEIEDDDSEEVYDEDEDDSEDDDDVDVNDFPDIEDLTTGTDEIDKIMEDIEPTESIVKKVETSMSHKVTTTASSDKSDNMVLPVIHRRQ